MSSFRKSFAKAMAKTKKLIHSSENSPEHQTYTQRTESLPSGVTANRGLTIAAPSSSYQSLPVSLQDGTQKLERQTPDTKSLTPGFTARPSQSPEINPTSSQQSLSITVVPNPWEAWTLDRDFLYQVYFWNAKHPENTLDRVFQKISTSIEQHQILFELVPDGPVPIRGFVKALAHVVKLGVTIAEAKVAALQFAEGVLQWVQKLADALGEGGSGQFIYRAWENLADIRQLIENVCTWANRMLNVRLIERGSVNDEILGFQKKFSQAIERFGVISNIHIAIGQDQLNQRLDSLNTHMNNQLESISQAQSDLVQIVQTPPLPAIPDVDVTYRSQKKMPCDPGTRKQVLDEIMKWISDVSDGSPCFFWLSGDPGVGNVLWAQFFINRNDAKTTDPQLYFPSIAKQMSACAPAVDHAVRNTLEAHPYLLNDDISLEQATKLFVDTIQVASAATPTKPVVVVFDALDETDLKRLKVTAEIFSRVLIDLPFNAKVFISSRVENVIRDSFAGHPRVTNIHLSAKNSVTDVTKFLETKVQEIMAEYHIDWSHWGHQRMRKLCSQASGLFIWAVTAIEYIRSEIHESGRECLDLVLDELNANGMDNINMLYKTILNRTYRQETGPWQTQRFRRIVGAILAQQTPLSIADLQGLLDLRNPKTGTPVDVEHFVRRLRTVLVPGVDEISGRTFPRVHKSFADFITSAKAEQFRVDMTESNGKLAIQCIHQLTCLWEGEMPTQLSYAVSHWSTHLNHVVGVPVEAEEADDDAAPGDDAQSLLSKEQDAAASVPVEAMQMKTAERNVQVSSICISANGTRIAYARGRSILLRDIETGNFIGHPFHGHTDIVNSVTFSPDSRYIISASDDKTIRIWDIETGGLVGEPLSGHTGFSLTAAFSPDGSQVVSASYDETVRTWDAKIGEALHILRGHTSWVILAVFSPDASNIVSVSNDNTVRVWNATGGDAVHILRDHSSAVFSAFFSSDGKNILSCSLRGTIICWDSETGKRVPDSCVEASLSFTGTETPPYIVTPQRVLQRTALSSSVSHSFRLAAGGTVGGIANTWLYLIPTRKLQLPHILAN